MTADEIKRLRELHEAATSGAREWPVDLLELVSALPALLDAAEEWERLKAANAALEAELGRIATAKYQALGCDNEHDMVLWIQSRARAALEGGK